MSVFLKRSECSVSVSKITIVDTDEAQPVDTTWWIIIFSLSLSLSLSLSQMSWWISLPRSLILQFHMFRLHFFTLRCSFTCAQCCYCCNTIILHRYGNMLPMLAIYLDFIETVSSNGTICFQAHWPFLSFFFASRLVLFRGLGRNWSTLFTVPTVT